MNKPNIYKTSVIVSFIIILAVAFSTVFGVLNVRAEETSDEVTIYRLYNPNTGEHFYTSESEEKIDLQEAGWEYEGSAWNAPAESGTPVYRLYNPNTGDHHYTCDDNEKASLVNDAGWNDEGISCYSDDSKRVTMYRLYNPNTEGAGSHHYTSSNEEKNSLVSAGWKEEGVAFYALEAGNPDIPKYEQLKQYLISKGTKVKSIIGTSYTIVDRNGDFQYDITYQKRSDSFSFGIKNIQGQKSSLIMFPNNKIEGDADVAAIIKDSPSSGIVNISSYNKSEGITFSPRERNSSSNEMLRTGFDFWDSLLKNHLGFDMKELGFSSYIR